MGDTPDMRGDIASALAESGYQTEEAQEADSWEGWDGDSAPAAEPEAEPSKSDAPADETPAETEAAQPEVPDEFWGVPLDGIPAEQAKAILDKLQQQESYIGQLQQRLNREPEPIAPPAQAADEDDPVSDESLLLALGYDPSDPYTKDEQNRALQMGRTILALEDKVNALQAQSQQEQVENAWNSQLNELEATYGKLPGSRDQVLRYAIEENIASPYEVYFRIAAPAKKQVEDAVAEARRAALRADNGGQVRPRATTGEDLGIDPKGSLRDAVAVAMKQAEKETGLSFKNLFGRKVAVEE